MIGRNDRCQEIQFLDLLRDQFECISVDKKCFCIAIDFEIKHLKTSVRAKTFLESYDIGDFLSYQRPRILLHIVRPGIQSA